MSINMTTSEARELIAANNETWSDVEVEEAVEEVLGVLADRGDSLGWEGGEVTPGDVSAAVLAALVKHRLPDVTITEGPS